MRGIHHTILSVGLTVGGFVHSSTGDPQKPPIRFTKSSQNFGNTGYGGVDNELGDLDGDGDIDVFVVSPSGPARVILNDGSGYFVDSGQSLLPAESETYSYNPVWRCDLGDVDGDGDLDALAGEWLWLNDGRGLFSVFPRKVESAPWDGASSGDQLDAPDSQFVDFDGDGDLDIWSGRLWRNDGGREFVPVETVLDEFPMARIAFGDFDEDGHVEAVSRGDAGFSLVHFWEEEVSVEFDLFGEGADFLFGGYFGIEAYDFERDGHLDIAASGNGFLVSGDGTGHFENPTLFGLGGGSGFAIGELNGESLWVVMGPGGLCEYGYGNYVGKDCLDWFWPSLDPELGDLDGDGDLDLWISEAVLKNSGDGFFSPGQLLGLSSGLQDVALGDIDSDGDLDAWLTWGQISGHVYLGLPDKVLLNDGFGRFEWKILEDDHHMGTSVALADFDNDSDLDAYVATEYVDVAYQEYLMVPDVLWVNVGAGDFLAPVEDLFPSSFGSAVAAGDLNGDGLPDVCVASAGGWMSRTYESPATRVLVNDASGHFTETVSLEEGGSDVELGDVDGDGDLDVVLKDHVWRNDGSGALSRIETKTDGGLADDLPFWAEEDDPVKFDLGDLDADGDLDILWIARSALRISLNLGDGTFMSSSVDVPIGWSGGDVALGDLDGDGGVDAWLVSVGPEVESWILVNDRKAGFTFEAVGRRPESSDSYWSYWRRPSVALGDLDGDRDLDAIVTRDHSISVWLNEEEPRIGSVESENGFLRIEYEGILEVADALGPDGFVPIEGASSPYMVPIGNGSRFFKAR